MFRGSVGTSAELHIVTSPGIELGFSSLHVLATKVPVEATEVVLVGAVVTSCAVGRAHGAITTIGVETLAAGGIAA